MSDDIAEAPGVKAPRVSSSITDDGKITLSLDGVTKTFDVSELPAAIITTLAAREARNLLIRAGEWLPEWTKLLEGQVPTKGSAGPKELDPWRLAYAHALADSTAKEKGIKAKSPEFATLLDESKQRAAVLDRAGLVKAKKIAAVVVHHARITGESVSLEDLAA